MSYINDIGDAIKNARIKKMITQEDLAELLNVTPTHVKHIESGHRKPSISVLFSIAKALDMSIDNVIFTNLSQSDKLLADINNSLKSLSDSELSIVLDVIHSIDKNRKQ